MRIALKHYFHSTLCFEMFPKQIWMFQDKLKSFRIVWKQDNLLKKSECFKTLFKNVLIFQNTFGIFRKKNFWNISEHSRMFLNKLKFSEHFGEQNNLGILLNNSECLPNTEMFCKTYLIVLTCSTSKLFWNNLNDDTHLNVLEDLKYFWNNMECF